MNIFRAKLTFVVLVLALLFAACGGGEEKPPSRWDKAQEESTKKVEDKKESSKKAGDKPVAGGEFNKFFPKNVSGYDIVPSQEKEGFALHKVKKDGKDVAELSINDVVSNPSAADKYKKSTAKIGGYPADDMGIATSILVSDRFQVKVISKGPSLAKADRETWLQKFDLSGLAALN